MVVLLYAALLARGGSGAATSTLVGDVPEADPDAAQLLYGQALQYGPQYNLPVPGATAAASAAAVDASSGTLVLRQVSRDAGAWRARLHVCVRIL